MTDPIMHAALWSALDDVVRAQGMSIHEFSTKAFGYRQALSRAKRHDQHGKAIWPSTQTVHKALRFAGLTFAQWGAMVETHRMRLDGTIVPAATVDAGCVPRGARLAA